VSKEGELEQLLERELQMWPKIEPVLSLVGAGGGQRANRRISANTGDCIEIARNGRGLLLQRAEARILAKVAFVTFAPHALCVAVALPI
jgi:hypothetical protein